MKKMIMMVMALIAMISDVSTMNCGERYCVVNYGVEQNYPKGTITEELKEKAKQNVEDYFIAGDWYKEYDWREVAGLETSLVCEADFYLVLDEDDEHVRRLHDRWIIRFDYNGEITYSEKTLGQAETVVKES